MACQLIIQDAVGQGQPGTTLMSLKVTGSASGCSSVSVTILCTGQHPSQHNAVPVVAGQWETIFTEQELKLAGCRECGSSSYPLQVRARCDDGVAACDDFKTWPAIPCVSGGACCPTVSIQVTEGDCDAQGRRNVTFLVTTAAATAPDCPPTVFAQIDFGDGMLGAGFGVPPNTVWQETHSYMSGSYTAKLHIIVPAGCPDIPVKVGPLVECPPGCPDPDDITVAVDDCDAEGRRIVSVNVLLPGSGSTTVSLDWQDGTPPDSNLPIQGGVLWTGWHHYLPPGPYKVTVSVAGCPPITKPVGPLPPCNGGNGNGNGKPCPWWDPRCWGSLCGGLLGAAMAALIAAGILFIIAGCTVLTPLVLAGPAGAALNALVSSALFIAAVATLVVGLALLTWWYLVCSKLPGYRFCATLHQVMTGIAWIVVAQSLLAIGLSVVGGVGCLIGMLLMWASWGTVLAYLQLLDDARCD